MLSIKRYMTLRGAWVVWPFKWHLPPLDEAPSRHNMGPEHPWSPDLVGRLGPDSMPLTQVIRYA